MLVVMVMYGTIIAYPIPIDIRFSVSKHRILHTQDMYLKSTLPTRNNFTEGRRFT